MKFCSLIFFSQFVDDLFRENFFQFGKIWKNFKKAEMNRSVVTFIDGKRVSSFHLSFTIQESRWQKSLFPMTNIQRNRFSSNWPIPRKYFLSVKAWKMDYINSGHFQLKPPFSPLPIRMGIHLCFPMPVQVLYQWML